MNAYLINTDPYHVCIFSKISNYFGIIVLMKYTIMYKFKTFLLASNVICTHMPF